MEPRRKRQLPNGPARLPSPLVGLAVVGESCLSRRQLRKHPLDLGVLVVHWTPGAVALALVRRTPVCRPTAAFEVLGATVVDVDGVAKLLADSLQVYERGVGRRSRPPRREKSRVLVQNRRVEHQQKTKVPRDRPFLHQVGGDGEPADSTYNR